MDGKVHLDQVFYGYGRSGYGLTGYSFDNEGDSWAAINACLAIGQTTGPGLPKPILLSRILGDKIVMARICNGAKDPSGRNTLFVHALVGLSQEVSKAHVTAFTLEEAGFFRDNLSGNPVDAIEVAANPTPATASHEPFELPAAIETSEPDEKPIRRIVSGREDELSWSTFAFEDMPGYDVICISSLAPFPAYRAMYGQDMTLLRRGHGSATNRPKSAPADTSEISRRQSPPSRDAHPTVAAGRKNKMFAPLIVSIVLNIALSAIVFMMTAGENKEAHEGHMPDASIEQEARGIFTDDKYVSDEELRRCKYPLQNFFLKQGEVAEAHPEQVKLFHRLLAYRDFVEKRIIKHRKEK